MTEVLSIVPFGKSLIESDDRPPATPPKRLYAIVPKQQLQTINLPTSPITGICMINQIVYLAQMIMIISYCITIGM